MGIWRGYKDGIPDYLARNYWWAYLWRPGVWFFNHQPVINLILFGQYKRLLSRTLHYLNCASPRNFLQLTCVYGQLSPRIAQTCETATFFLCDIADVQLELAQRKLRKFPNQAIYLSRMNAEGIAFRNDSLDTVLVFFLLHELPREARHRTLAEVIRILAPGGQLVIADYAPLPEQHFLYKIAPFRWILTRLEPFLSDLWNLDLAETINTLARRQHKNIKRRSVEYFFNRFYRIEVYERRL